MTQLIPPLLFRYFAPDRLGVRTRAVPTLNRHSTCYPFPYGCPTSLIVPVNVFKRADESIRHLDCEVGKFLGRFPVIRFDRNLVFSDEDSKSWNELVEQVNLPHGELAPFSVLAGEIIHHLRSAFDHTAWQLSSIQSRTNPKTRRQIEFPVFFDRDPCERCERALTKGEHSRYCRKVQGITSSTALKRIEGLQPYKRPDVHSRLRHPLWLIHDFDRIDKHQELNLVLSIVTVKMDAYGDVTFRTAKDAASGGVRLLPGPTKVTDVKVDGKISAEIAFGQLQEREDKSLVPTLEELLKFARETIESFAASAP
jgi:hypothetical protein